MSAPYRIRPALIEIADTERSALCASLQARLPHLELNRAPARLETVLDELGALCQTRGDGALMLSIPLADHDELHALVRPGAWAWR